MVFEKPLFVPCLIQDQGLFRIVNMTAGQIDALWWDAVWWGGMFVPEMWNALDLEKEVLRLQTHIIINNHCSLPGDFDTPECIFGFY